MRMGSARRNIDVLARAGTDEQQGVATILAVDGVAAIARIPDKDIISCPEQGRVVARPPGHMIEAVAAEEDVGAVAPGDLVVARAAIEGEVHEPREAIAGDNDVIAVAAMEDDILGTADIEREVRRRGFVEAHACAVGGDAGGVCSGTVVEYDSVDARAAID